MTAVTDTDIQFRQSLFLVKQHVEKNFPNGDMRKAVMGIVSNAIDGYEKTQSRYSWVIEDTSDIDGKPGVMATLVSGGRQHRIGFRHDNMNKPSLFIWSVTDSMSGKPVSHQLVIPMSDDEQLHLRDGKAEVQYWVSANLASTSSIVAQACLGLGALKIVMPEPISNNSITDSIPLKIFKII